MIYIDFEFKCHTSNPDGIFREVEHPFFGGKCTTFVEGHCYDDSMGYLQIYPWKDCNELDAAQREYERMMSELDQVYQEGVNSLD